MLLLNLYNMEKYWFVVVFVTFAVNFPQLIFAGTRDGTEKRLFQKLFKSYNPSPRPTSSALIPVSVKFCVSLNQILDMDEKKQSLTTSVWVTESWTDDNLRWSTADFDGLDTLIVASDILWIPDIFIFNTAGGKLGDFVNATGSRLKILNNGHVTWLVPLVIKSSCNVDATYFPYDEQTCDIHFGSWIYDESQLDLQPFPSEPYLNNYLVNSEFSLLGVTMRRELVDEKCCPGSGSHPMIVVQINIKRKSIYYNYIIIAPTMLLSILSLFSFCLPPHHGDRISIGLTVFLTLYVLQLLISANVPDTNTTPILGIFTFSVMTLNCTSLIIATVVMNIKTRANMKPVPEVPPFLSKLCRGILGKLTCMQFSTRLNKFDLCSDDDTTKTDEKYKKNHDEKQDGSVEFYPNVDGNDIEEEVLEMGALWNDSEAVNSESTLAKNTSLYPLIECSEYEREDSLRLNRFRMRGSYKLALVNSVMRLRGQIQGEIIPSNDEAITDLNTSSDSNAQRTGDDNLARKELKDLRKEMTLKHEWCLVAETLDKGSFIFYVIATFITIMTVLVIVPSCR